MSQSVVVQLKKVVNSFADDVNNMDIVKAPHSSCSNAETCLDKSDDFFETRLKKDVKNVRKMSR